MKALFTMVLAILCGVILLWGNIHWNNKTAVTADAPSTEAPKGSNKAVNKTNDSKKRNEDPTILAYTQNWPPEAVETFKQAQAEGRPYKVTLAGSSALGDEPDGWAYLTKEGLIKSYGEELITVDIFEYDITSLQFVQENRQEELAAANSSLVILEPLTLNDNGYVAIDNSHSNIQTIIDAIKEANPEAVVILQPSNPLYNAKYYPIQVAALKDYTEQNGIPYLDHWTAWPDPNSEEITSYLTNGQPNAKGHELWANYLLDYLIAEN